MDPFQFKTKLLSAWELVRTSYWFVPTLLSLGAFALGVIVPWIDGKIPSHWGETIGWIYQGSADGARKVLSTIAGSMITVAGVVFSITIVALVLASNQFGPRILRNFMKDAGNQVVLGTFLASFIYCLLVLRTVKDGGIEGLPTFIPQISVTLALVFALASIGVLIYFIHHVAASIQADRVAAAIATDLNGAIDDLFPEELGDEPRREPDSHPARAPPEDESAVIRAPAAGYIQMVDQERLMSLAMERDVLLRLESRPGQFVVEGQEMIRVWPGSRLDGDLEKRIGASVAIDVQRSLMQDVEFAVDQLVEVAARALSPGINDPFTATICIDRLGDSLAKLAGREIPSHRRLDPSGRLRVIAYPVTFPKIVNVAMDQLRQYGCGHPAVAIRLLETIALVIRRARREEDRDALLSHAARIQKAALESGKDDTDRKDIEERFSRIVAALRAGR